MKIRTWFRVVDALLIALGLSSLVALIFVFYEFAKLGKQ